MAICEWNPPVTNGFPHKKTIMWNAFPCNEVVMTKIVHYFKETNTHLYREIILLTHWGWVTHIRANRLTIIGLSNGLWPGRRQAIIWTNAGILLIGPLGTNLSGILIKIYTFSIRKMQLKTSPGKWRPFCLGLNVLNKLVELIKTLWPGDAIRRHKSGGHLIKKDGLTRYGDSHVKDKTS